MDETRLTLVLLWIMLMLTYLLGDILRIYSGDLEPGKMMGMPVTKRIYFGLAVLMLFPILMILLTLKLPYNIDRWANIVVAVLFFGFNVIGLPGYPSAYDKFLIAVSLVFNGLTVWYAWNWMQP